MADDDEINDEMDEELATAEEFEAPEDGEPEELDEAELEDDEAFVVVGDDEEEFAEDDEEEGDDDSATDTPLRRATGEDDDDDDDMLTPDDVEADLDTILKDRLVSAEEAAGEDDDDEEPEDRSDPGDRLQPKRPDEQLCSNCFLLVRNSAPGCPVGADDDCPIFA